MNTRLLLLASLLAAAVNADDDCSLECNGRGTCVFGDADFVGHADPVGKPLDFHEDANLNGMHCNCESGFTGLECDHSFENCDDENNKCYHNGVCVGGTINSSGKTIHICDCREAKEDGIKYVGLHCEQASPEEHPKGPEAVTGVKMCNDEGVSDEYCLNDGLCTQGDDNVGGPPGKSDICDCQSAFTGRHCQLHKESLPTDTCDLTCLNNGQCQFGYRESGAEMAFDPEGDLEDSGQGTDKLKYQHCLCKEGFSGTHCERQHTKCGDKFCFHGSTCLKPEDTEELDEYHCDCVAGRNGTHSFAGINCEQHSTSFCEAQDGVNGKFFCTNGGMCARDESDFFSCTCPRLFRGPHCEFPASVDLPGHHGECKTKCQNGGKCTNGVKDHGILNTLPDVNHLMNGTYNQFFEHCICPTGFAGIHCEHEIVTCPKGEHVCFHGTECVSNGDEEKCICSSTAAKFTAGKFCQHEASTVCSTDSRMFCTNGGKCLSFDEGCDCKEGFKGDHCEYTTSTFAEANGDDAFTEVLPDNYQDEQNLKLFIISGVVALVGIVLILAAVVVTDNSEEFRTVRAPPRSMFPPASAFQPGSAAEEHEEAQQQQSNNGSALMEEAAPSDMETGESNGSDDKHTNELL